MAGDKKHEQIWWIFLGALIILVPVFWHAGCFQSPFLYAKELLIKYSISFLLALFLWRYNKFFSLLFLFCFFSTLFINLSERSLWALSNLRDFFLYYLLLRLILKPKDFKRLIRLWLIALILPILITWLQYFGIDPIYTNKEAFHGQFYDNYREVWRMRASFGNPHILHSWIAICTPLIFLLRLRFAIPSFLLLLTTIFIVGSRGPSLITCIAGASFAVSYLIFKKKQWIWFLLITLSLSILTVFLKGQDFIQCIGIRIRMFQAGWQKILEHPITGHGFNSFSSLNVRLPCTTLELQAHNEYAQTYIELGIFSLLFLPFLIYYFSNLKKLSTKEAAILGGLLVTFALNSLYSFPFHTAHAAFFFLTIIALYDTLLTKNATALI